MPPKRHSAVADDDGEDGRGSSGSSSPSSQQRKVGGDSAGSPRTPPSSSSSSALSRPLLTSQHSTYDSASSSEAVKRTVRLRKGEFQWNEEDRQALKDRYSDSALHRLYSQLPFAPTSLTRVHLYGSNAIKSTRYSLLTFLPVNLFEQLAPWIKPANFYFLCIAVLQAFPSISTTEGRPSILLPLLIVVLISAVKDALEDYGRWKGDFVKNNEQYKTYHKGHFHKVHSKDLLVGDLLMIEDGQRVPADCILLVSGVGGGSIAYVDTKNLDGETNLKPKQVPKHMLRGWREDWRGVNRMDLRVVVEPPSGDMRSFSGELQVEGDGAKAAPKTPSSKASSASPGATPKATPNSGARSLSPQSGKGRMRPVDESSSEVLTLDHFILSDCLVRNTPWLIGLVIYSGEDTKIRQNMKSVLTHQHRTTTSHYHLPLRHSLRVVSCLLPSGRS